MKCAKDFMITLSLLLVVIGITTGTLATQINTIDAKLESRNEIIYSVPHLEKDVDIIKNDLNLIKNQMVQVNINLKNLGDSSK